MLKIPFNDIMSKTMKATAVRYAVHKFFNLCRNEHGANMCKIVFILFIEQIE